MKLHQASSWSKVCYLLLLIPSKGLVKRQRAVEEAELCFSVAPKGNNSAADGVADTRVDNGALVASPWWSSAATSYYS